LRRSTSNSCSNGTCPRDCNWLISSRRFCSQFRMYGVAAARRGRPVQMVDRMVLSKPASTRLDFGRQREIFDTSRAHATHTFLDAWVAPDSTAATNLVPTQTADAPYIKDAAIPRPVIKSKYVNDWAILVPGLSYHRKCLLRQQVRQARRSAEIHIA